MPDAEKLTPDEIKKLKDLLAAWPEGLRPETLLTVAKHASPDLHRPGESLLAPGLTKSLTVGGLGSVGLSQAFSLEDHVHGVS